VASAEPIHVRTLTDGGQAPEDVAAELIEFLSAARQTLEIALYDVRLPGAVGDSVVKALTDAVGRGVAVRLLYNTDSYRPIPVPPPPSTRPELIEALPFPTRDVPGRPDLMHHKYVVRDSAALWCGSTNWTLDSWHREENVIAIVSSPELAADYRANFEELWDRRDVEHSGRADTLAAQVGGVPIRAWFCPGHAEDLTHRIAAAIGGARRRVRIASPVLTSGAILGTLAQVASDGQLDLAGVVDATQIAQVFSQWEANGNATWKLPLLRRTLEQGHFSGKHSTPYAPGAVHDYMHAKMTVADDTVFVGSFNLSRSGERNAENVLEIADSALADRMAAFIDAIRERYPDPVAVPEPGPPQPRR
jgi:phosphatidylserine/phosphatidylglycerophosphate/cardiolipin synthase-like enzyme